MSGLINSAGSRSGVIGTTELDVEEGEWTPTNTNSGSNTLVTGALKAAYIKIGKLVVCNFYLRVIDTTGAGDIPTAGDMGGLPYTANSGVSGADGTWGAGGGVVTYSNGFGTEDTSIQVNSADTTWRFYAGYSQKQLPDNKNAKGTITYYTS